MSVTAEQARTTGLDALALIAAAHEGREQDGNLLLSTYTDQAEIQDLFLAVVAHAVCLVRIASECAGIPPEKLLGAVAVGIRDTP
jgi:hypothetical protein